MPNGVKVLGRLRVSLFLFLNALPPSHSLWLHLCGVLGWETASFTRLQQGRSVDQHPPPTLCASPFR